MTHAPVEKIIGFIMRDFVLLVLLVLFPVVDGLQWQPPARPPTRSAVVRALFPDGDERAPRRAEESALDAAKLEYALSPLCALESNLLRSCAACFEEKIQPIDATTTETILLKALALEKAAVDERDGAVLNASAVSEALHGDWRLVFSNSARTCEEGVTGYASTPFVDCTAIFQRTNSKYASQPRAQCIEVLQLPFGVKSAVSLKGDWALDEDGEGCILRSTYTSIEAGEQALPAMPRETTSLAAVVHVGVDARLERSPAGDLFVYKRQRGAEERIDVQLNKMLG